MDRDGAREVLQQSPQPLLPTTVHPTNPNPTDAASSSKESVQDFPQTPAGRVPLRDLMDDIRTSQASRQCSPGDRVSWNNSPQTSEGPCSFVTPAAKRGKKRARSSSPVSSQKRQEPLKASFNLQNLQKSLSSPQPDPVLDFEQRFYSRAKYETPNRPSASAAADLMPASSPHTPAMHSSGSAKLRRTKSCGVEWPEQKRRKVWRPHEQASQDAERGASGPCDDKGTAIHFLLDQIHHDLPSVRHEASRKPSSAPQPAKEPRVGETHVGKQKRSKPSDAPGALGSDTVPEEPVVHGQGIAAGVGRRSSPPTVGSRVTNPRLQQSPAAQIPQPSPTLQQPVELPKNSTGPAPTARVPLSGSQPSQQVANRHVNVGPVDRDPSLQSTRSERDITGEKNESSFDVGEDDEDFMDTDLLPAELEDLVQRFDERPSHANGTSGQIAEHGCDPASALLPSQGKQATAAQGAKGKGGEPLSIWSDDEFDDGTDFGAIFQEMEKGTQMRDVPNVREDKAHVLK